MNKNWDSMQNFSVGVAGDSAETQIFQTSGIVRNESSSEAHIRVAG